MVAERAARPGEMLAAVGCWRTDQRSPVAALPNSSDAGQHGGETRGWGAVLSGEEKGPAENIHMRT